jgi:hypothetical protein
MCWSVSRLEEAKSLGKKSHQKSMNNNWAEIVMGFGKPDGSPKEWPSCVAWRARVCDDIYVPQRRVTGRICVTVPSCNCPPFLLAGSAALKSPLFLLKSFPKSLSRYLSS